MERLVETELLDTLPAQDQRALRSRADLRRINWLMGNAGVLLRLLRRAIGPHRLVEIGAGDGTFLLRIARQLAPKWGHVEAVLVDQQSLLGTETLEGFSQLGWKVQTVQADVFDWLAEPGPAPETIVMANLFLHHFSEEQLRRLLQLASARCRAFVACEPRREVSALTASRLLGLIGCNAVTRHDAPASVRAGFSGRDLSALWPSDESWQTDEGRAGMFGHFFVAWKSTAS